MKSLGALRQAISGHAPGVIVLLAGVTLVPLLGIGWLAGGQVSDARRESQQTEAISLAAQDLQQAVQLRSLLDAEAYWSHSFAAVDTFNLPLETVLALTGLDIELGLTEARLAVDQALARPGVPPEAAARIREVRAGIEPGSPVESIRIGFDDVVTLASHDLEQDLELLVVSAAQLGNSGQLSNSIQALDLAAAARHDMTEVVESYFSIRFPVGNAVAVESARMLAADSRYAANLDRLSEVAVGSPAVGSVLASISDDPDQQFMMARVRETSSRVIVEGTDSPAFSQQLDLAEVSNEVQTFRSAQVAVESHAVLVRTASNVVAEEALIAHGQAVDRQRQTLYFTLGLVVAALGTVILASIWIVAPLRRMATAVGQLGDGSPTWSVPEAGPAEVRQAAQALNEAIENISVVEGMATALARRDLDNPAFSQPPKGKLGASLCAAVTELAASMSEGEAFRAQLAHEAAHDGLTGLYNRSEIINQLDRALASVGSDGGTLAVLFIDIDGFKGMNDAYGHGVGDEILRVVAARIEDCTRGRDRVGRLGGDEFVVVAESVDTVDGALGFAERIRSDVSDPVEIEGVSYSVTVSIGVSVSGDSNGSVLLREADMALYEAKATGRNRVYLCDDELRNRQSEQTSIEQRLERAILENELTLYYQPIVEATSGKMSSVEALLRWPSPDGRFESPADFIPVAERSDLILRIDHWVMNEVSRQLSSWSNEPDLGQLAVSVNLSARSVSRPNLAQLVLGSLAAHGVSPDRLTIEVTETALLDDVQTAAASLRELRAAGVMVAIDDFGTGFASLAQLRRLPLDVLKIDQGFVANIDRPDDRSLIQLTIDTGHLLGARIVAEGVEEAVQHDTLVEMGVDLAQGYLFARPMPGSDLAAWMSVAV